MISTLRPDLDNVDEYVRNTTARAFAVVAQSLGVGTLLPFLKAVCQSRKSWQVSEYASMRAGERSELGLRKTSKRSTTKLN